MSLAAFNHVLVNTFDNIIGGGWGQTIISISVNLNVLATEYSKEPSFDNPLHVFVEKKITIFFFTF